MMVWKGRFDATALWPDVRNRSAKSQEQAAEDHLKAAELAVKKAKDEGGSVGWMRRALGRVSMDRFP